MSTLKKYQSKVDALAASVDKRKEQISSNSQWTDEAKAEALRELSEKTREQRDTLKDELKNERIERSNFLEPKLFSAGDDPASQMSYRDGIEKASKLAADQDQLSDLMDQALDTGDKLLAKAAAYTAFKSGYFDLAKRAYPEKAYQNYFDEYLALQEALTNPLSREALDESFMFAALG